MEKVLGEGLGMDWRNLFINWEANLFWIFLGWIVGVLVARYYYRKTGADLIGLKAEIIEKIDTLAGISEEQKEALKAGIFYTHPWENEYLRKTLGGGGRGREKLGG